MVSFDINGLFGLFGFIFGLISIIFLFGIIKRTKDDIRHGFMLLFAAIVSFVVFEIFTILSSYQILSGMPVVTNVFMLVFIFFITAGMFKLKTLIRGLSDFGQAFIVTSEKSHEDKLASIVKDVKDVCFITLKNPYREVVKTLAFHNIDTASMQFIDASGTKSDAENCTSIKNNPEDIKKALDRILKEKGSRCVVVDEISELKGIKDFEIPLFIQDASSLIKTNESQGFFVGKIEKLGKGTINDISLIVDKTIGDDK
jgi:hypothetical protein